MRDFGDKITIEVNNNVFLKDPESSELGRRIMSASISTIDELDLKTLLLKNWRRKPKQLRLLFTDTLKVNTTF